MKSIGVVVSKAKIKGDWLIKCRKIFKTSNGYRHCWLYRCCIVTLEKWSISQDGEILVTGATGGVGSVAISLLNNLGYQCVPRQKVRTS